MRERGDQPGGCWPIIPPGQVVTVVPSRRSRWAARDRESAATMPVIIRNAHAGQVVAVLVAVADQQGSVLVLAIAGLLAASRPGGVDDGSK